VTVKKFDTEYFSVETSRMILVVSLSPAWQRTLEFPFLKLGAVNRASRVIETASGKGVNVARVATQLGADVKLLTTLGGARGALLARSLRSQQIRARIVRCANETRICQTLLTDTGATELVEEPPPMSRREIAAVRRAFDTELRRAKRLVLIGTVPRGVREDFYATLVRRVCRHNIPTLVDAQGKLLLHAIRARPFLVRINRAELAAATGRTRSLSLSETFAAARRLMRHGASWVVITDSANEVAIVSRDGQWTINPPQIRVVNPIGSGDSMLAGIAQQLAQGKPVLDSIRYGIACGAANALTPTAGDVSLSDVSRLLRQIVS
jgi:tagatose 6-phosphate kinase